MARNQVTYEMYDKNGRIIRGIRYESIRAAKMMYSADQRKLYNIRIFALPGGGFDAFPQGHPIPHGSRLA